MTIELDHLMWGAPSLESGMAAARELFGAEPLPGGAHPGLGTRNALLSLGDSVYLEIIAPDTDQALSGTLGGKLATLEAPALITWAAASSDLDGVAAGARRQSLSVRGPVPTERSTPDGTLLRWRLLFIGDHPFGALVPFFIDWMDAPHPARSSPAGGAFVRLEIRTPEADRLNRIYDGLGISLRATAADRSGLIATLRTPAGEVTLDSIEGSAGWSF